MFHFYASWKHQQTFDFELEFGNRSGLLLQNKLITIVSSLTFFLKVPLRQVCRHKQSAGGVLQKGALRNFSKFIGRHPC